MPKTTSRGKTRQSGLPDTLKRSPQIARKQ